MSLLAALAPALVLLIALAPAPACAATLSGFLSDANSGESLAFATVVVRGDSVSTGGLSNADGYYAVNGLRAGAYVVTYQAIGYDARRDTLSLAAGEQVRRDVALGVAPLQMEGVEITADRGKEEQQLQPGFIAFDARQLKRMPSVGEPDIIRSLQMLPGIQAASDISSGLYIRGGGPDQTLILLDQIPLYNPTHAFGFFSTFNADAIKDVNLYKGAYPAQYGGRLSSVLDVTNREGNRKTFQGRGGISLIAARTTLEGPVGKGSWIVSGRRTYLEPVLSAIRTDENEIPSYYFYDTNARLHQDLSDSDQLTISGYFGRDDLNLDLDEGSFVDLRWGNAAMTAKWTHIISPTLFGNFLVAGSEYKSDTRLSFFETPIRFTNSLRDLSVKADLDYHPNAAHVVTAGLLASQYKFTFEQEFNRDAQAGIDQKPHSYALYAQDEWTASPLTKVRSGVHVRYFSEGSRWIAEPRVSISQIVGDGVRLKLASGGYHQFLQLVSTEGFSGGDFWVPTDATAEPGRSWQGVVGLEWEKSRRYFFTAESYYTDLSDLVLFDNDAAVDGAGTASEDVFKTGGSGHATGLELFAERRTGALTGWLGYTLGWSRRTFSEVNQGKSFPPKYDRRHDVKLVANYDRGKWSYGANFIFGTGQAFTPAGGRYSIRNPATGEPPEDDLLFPAERNSARLLPYHRIDVNVARDATLFGQKAEWFLQIFNLYSRRNEWFIQYNTEEETAEPEVVRMLPIIPTIGVNFEF
ncbi:MAG: carboxypeptidase regulatory-like domain-containing protein [bacterium]